MEDFLNLFIKMCEKASDLQRIWIPDKGDYYYNKEIQDSFQITTSLIHKDKEDMKKNCFWLPNEYMKDRKEVAAKRPPYIINKMEKYFYEEKANGTIELFGKFDEVYYLQLTMYVFFSKKWDKKTQEWIYV